MTSIDPTSQLTALIRSQLGALGKTPGKTTAGGRTKSAANSGKHNTGKKDIASVIAQRVQQIAPNDDQAERKAFRIFLEAVLLAELGENLVNDPAFYRLLDDVQKQMEQDTELAPSIHQAARLLLSSHQPPKA